MLRGTRSGLGDYPIGSAIGSPTRYPGTRDMSEDTGLHSLIIVK